MNKQFTIKSKINVKPTKIALFIKLILNICLIIIVLAGVISIFFDGVKISTLGTISTAFIIVTAFKKRPKYNEHHEFSVADMVVTKQETTIIYKLVAGKEVNNIQIRIDNKTVSEIEYSDELACFLIVGKGKKIVLGKKSKEELLNEVFVYVEKGKEPGIIGALEEATGVTVKFVYSVKQY